MTDSVRVQELEHHSLQDFITLSTQLNDSVNWYYLSFHKNYKLDRNIEREHNKKYGGI